MTLNTSTFLKVTDEQVTSIDFDDAVFAEMSELDTLAIESFIAFPQKFSEAAIKRSRSKHPTGRGEQKQSKQWFTSPWGMNEKAECKQFNKALMDSRKPSIAEGFAEIEFYNDINHESIHRMRDEEWERWEDFQAAQAKVQSESNDSDRSLGYDADITEAINNVELNAYAPEKPFSKIRTWYPKKVGNMPTVARLTERQFTAGVSDTVPSNYDSYEQVA